MDSTIMPDFPYSFTEREINVIVQLVSDFVYENTNTDNIQHFHSKK